MLRLTGYPCCAVGQGTLLSFAPLHPGENGTQMGTGLGWGVNRLVVQWTSDPLTAIFNNLAYRY